MEKLVRTLLLMFYAVFPPVLENTSKAGASRVPSCQPRDIGSLHRFLDERGHFRVFFEKCLPLAAPFVLFRLKRQGYSSSRVRVCAEGLIVEGDR